MSYTVRSCVDWCIKDGRVSNNERPSCSYANKICFFYVLKIFKASLKAMTTQWRTDGIKTSFESDSPSVHLEFVHE